MTSDFGAEPPRGARMSRVRAEALLAAGLDPGASRSPWGLAVLQCKGRTCRAEALASSYNSIEVIMKLPSAPTGVDAPLSPPYRGYRECERRALRLGAKLLPGGLQGMKLLAIRGYSIKMLLLEAGVPVYETHPTSFAALTGAPVKPPGRCCSVHEWHAVLAAIAAVAGWRGEALTAHGGGCSIVVGFKEGVRYKIKIGGIEVVLTS